ncbi:MAG: SPFH domain-containing protein, partial [Polyangiaceae bacterium]
MSFLIALVVTALSCFVIIPAGLAFARFFGVYLIVEERSCVVYELFGRVRGAIDTPGLHCPWLFLGPFGVLVPFFGKRTVVDLRLDQMYLRSQGVNSEEGAPMG